MHNILMSVRAQSRTLGYHTIGFDFASRTLQLLIETQVNIYLLTSIF